MKANKGFTLIEVILVMVIISAIVLMGVKYLQQSFLMTKIDTTTQQMQQILNAATSYYVYNGKWPGAVNTNGMNCLQGMQNDSNDTPFNDKDCALNSGVPTNYLPNFTQSPATSPWIENTVGAGNYYVAQWSTSNPNQYVAELPLYVGEGTAEIANIIASRLPMGAAVFNPNLPPGGTNACTDQNVTDPNHSCWIMAYVTIPPQTFNNIKSVSFGNLYHHGACVPVPSCPENSTPEIFVMPVGVAGVNDANSNNVYPISSFTAYATPPAADGNPLNCWSDSITGPCYSQGDSGNPGGDPSDTLIGNYWRVCLQVITEKGDVRMTNNHGTPSNNSPYFPWGGNVSVAAITRCSPSSESSNSGSDFTVYTY